MERKKYAQVGIGGRARMYYEAITGKYKDTSELVGFCDVNQARMDYANERITSINGAKPVPTYKHFEFEDMIKKEKPDIVIVTSIDRTHHTYIVKAMEMGCDVITEKPMTIDEDKAQEIFDAIKRTGRKLRVTFNYRYAPHNTKIRELIMNGVIGDVLSVQMEWLLNTSHGADYFRRWHRDKRNSGGLLVHKATHHFDLINFWLGTRPKTVFATGDLMFYGRANAEKRGAREFYYRAYGSEAAKNDPFSLDLTKSEIHKRLYLDAEKEDGYLRDQSVFGDGISIEDTMAVMVKYKSKAILSYALNAYMPWEGYRVSFNGTKGRIQAFICESTYVNAGGSSSMEGTVKQKTITVLPMFGEPYNVDIEEGIGGHGGGDTVLLEELFGDAGEDRFKRAATHVDGAMSILVGIAANKSIASGMPVNIDDLVRFE